MQFDKMNSTKEILIKKKTLIIWAGRGKEERNRVHKNKKGQIINT